MSQRHLAETPGHKISPVLPFERAQEGARHLSVRPLLLGTLVLAAGLRIVLLGHNSLWYDEAYTAWIAGLQWHEILGVLRTGDVHPPLYFLMMKGWISLAGVSEVALRFPSACVSCISVALTYALLRRSSSEGVGLLGALLVSVSPLHIMAAQEARMYPFLGALALGSTLALARSVQQGGISRWALYAGVGTTMIYTHYLGFLVLLAHGLWVFFFARRSQDMAPWLTCMAAAGLLYIPWVPTLLYQVIQGRGSLPVGAFGVGDLMGLFAFGGSLFGTANYFAVGTLGTIEQLILYLPFLAVLWQGAVSFRSNRQALALVGLPLVVPVGSMLLLSIVKPMFYPRWFSFLFPFYAMFLARGLVQASESFRSRQARPLAFLTAGLLLYSMPVLTHYYFDPAFRPYQWRAAAAFVQARVNPQDFFLFVNHPAEIAFTYYFTGPHPSRTLPIFEMVPSTDHPPSFTADRARQLAAQYPRVWLIATPPFDANAQRRLRTSLETAFHVVEVRTFSGVWVILLEERGPGTRRGTGPLHHATHPAQTRGALWGRA